MQLGLEHYTRKISWKNEITTPQKNTNVPLKRDHFKKESSLPTIMFTPPKFNMEPENDGFQKQSPFPGSRDFFSGSMLNFRGIRGHIFHLCKSLGLPESEISLRSWVWKPTFTGRQNWRLCRLETWGGGHWGWRLSVKTVVV